MQRGVIQSRQTVDVCDCISVSSYVPWDTLVSATKLMLSTRSYLQECSFTNFVISHLQAVLYDVKTSSLHVT